MDEYVVTELAGPVVAGYPNPGVGEKLPLTAGQAEHPLRLGYVLKVRVEDAPAAEPEQPRRRRRRK